MKAIIDTLEKRFRGLVSSFSLAEKLDAVRRDRRDAFPTQAATTTSAA